MNKLHFLRLLQFMYSLKSSPAKAYHFGEVLPATPANVYQSTTGQSANETALAYFNIRPSEAADIFGENVTRKAAAESIKTLLYNNGESPVKLRPDLKLLVCLEEGIANEKPYMRSLKSLKQLMQCVYKNSMGGTQNELLNRIDRLTRDGLIIATEGKLEPSTLWLNH